MSVFSTEVKACLGDVDELGRLQARTEDLENQKVITPGQSLAAREAFRDLRQQRIRAIVNLTSAE